LSQLIVLAGPTASGKTKLSIDLAKLFDAEIINADSRQVYRKLNIGTAKPTTIELNAIPHHFIDIKNPDEDYNAGEFETNVISFLEDYFTRKNTAILVGGSGLYINAVVNGFDPLPKASEEIRQKWMELLEREGIEFLKNELIASDPIYAKTADLDNPQRLIRALEIIDSTGKTYSSQRQKTKKSRPFKSTLFALSPERSALYDSINQRVDKMMEDGLLSEVESLIQYRTCNALQTVGYKELFDHIDGKSTLNEAIDKIKQHTRNFAKRQTTWFKRQNDFISLKSDYINEIQKHLKSF
jgi:tRNA dimethylallyltransferase